MADAILTTTEAGTSTHVAIEVKERRVTPDFFEAVVMQITRLKFGSLEEGARINLALGTDAAGGSCGPAHVKTWQLVAKSVQVEK